MGILSFNLSVVEFLNCYDLKKYIYHKDLKIAIFLFYTHNEILQISN